VADDQAVQRPPDDDYDLLTYSEAGARLAEEIRSERRHLGDLEEQARTGAADVSAHIAAVRKRISDLTDAAERQARQRCEARDFVRFFGYDPKAGRP
jgi:hypothetical protein